MSDSLQWIDEELDDIQRRGLRRRRRVVEPLPGGRCRVDGRELWNFAGNDYLNLSQDARVIAAAQRAAAESGTGATASALICGRTPWHARLEEKLAAFEGTEAALLFPTGFAANMGVIAAVVERGDALFSDRLNHASLVDGCRLSKAALTIYDRDNLDGLDEALSATASARRRLIVTDSVFSMDGDVAPLAELCDLAEAHDAMLLIDEAHATGVFGEQGRGLAERDGVEDRMHFRVGTLSKAVGACGGFVSGPQPLIEWLWNRARPQIFSTALPPPVCAAACAAVEIIQSEPWRRTDLLQRAKQFRAAVVAAGFKTIPAAVAPIVPILLDDPKSAVRTAAALEEQGFLVGAIRPPSVPPGTSRLRITLTYAHNTEVIEQFTAGLSAVLRDVARVS